LYTAEPLSTDCCHLDDAAVLINRDDGDDTAIREEYLIERTVRVHEDLLGVAGDVFKLRHEPLEIAGGEGEQKPVAGPIWAHTLCSFKKRDRDHRSWPRRDMPRAAMTAALAQ
jgi:hypothetical protein